MAAILFYANRHWTHVNQPPAKSWSEPGPLSFTPYDDLRVMAGQGTTAIRVASSTVPDLDGFFACRGGAVGQLSGDRGVAAKDIKPSVRRGRRRARRCG